MQGAPNSVTLSENANSMRGVDPGAGGSAVPLFFFVAILAGGGWYFFGPHATKASDEAEQAGEPGHWSSDQHAEAIRLCTQESLAYESSDCRVRAFCRCAVSDYEGRVSFDEFRDNAVQSTAQFAKRGSFGYVCTERVNEHCHD
jgi:hypothetical protein